MNPESTINQLRLLWCISGSLPQSVAVLGEHNARLLPLLVDALLGAEGSVWLL